MTEGVHPQLRPILAQLQALPRLCDTPLDELRGARKRPSVLPGLPVALAEDRKVPDGAREVPVRLYRDAEGVLPVIVLLHGGGFVSGGLDGYYDALCRQLCRMTGAAVLAVAYRLAPENPFPAAEEDVEAVLRWVCGHGGEWSIDPARIAVLGISAGGALAAAAALKRRGGGPALRGAALFYPVLDLPDSGHPSFDDYADGHYLTAEDMRWFWGQYLSRPEDGPRAAPLRAPDLQGTCPSLILAAGCDPLRDEARAFHASLRAAGCQSELVDCPGMLHGFLAFAVERREHYLRLAADWLKARLA